MPSVLLVDDDPDGLDLRRMILEHHGHTVATASNPADALYAVTVRAFDCVVTDLRLPKLTDGIQLIRDLRIASPQLRIVVLSGITAALDNQEERKQVDEILTKPIRSEQLLQALTWSGLKPATEASAADPTKCTPDRGAGTSACRVDTSVGACPTIVISNDSKPAAPAMARTNLTARPTTC